MADIKQIYGPNQTAGIEVAGTGKSTPKSDGTTPLAQLVGLVSSGGVIIDPLIGYAEDSVAVSGDIGVQMLSVRRDTAAASAANLDYSTINTDSLGLLWSRPDGGVLDDAPDAGNPVKVGARYNATRPTYSDADRTTLQSDTRGNLAVVVSQPNGVNPVPVGTPASSGNALNLGLTVNAQNYLYDGTTLSLGREVAAGLTTGVGAWAVDRVPSGVAPIAIAPAANSALASSKVLKASAGNLFSLNVAATTVSGYVLLFNATSLPGDGAVTPVRAWALNAGQTAEFGFDPPLRLGTGITVGFSSNTTTPFTLAASATAFISGEFI